MRAVCPVICGFQYVVVVSGGTAFPTQTHVFLCFGVFFVRGQHGGASHQRPKFRVESWNGIVNAGVAERDDGRQVVSKIPACLDAVTVAPRTASSLRRRSLTQTTRKVRSRDDRVDSNTCS